MRVNYFQLGGMSLEERTRLYRRAGVNLETLMAQVAPILDEVRHRGDDAVREFTKRFDGADINPSQFRISPEEMDRAVKGLPDDLREAIEVSIANIRKFHERQIEPPSWEIEISPGIVAGEKVVPIASVGLYVPRGQRFFPIDDDDGRSAGPSGGSRTHCGCDTAGSAR